MVFASQAEQYRKSLKTQENHCFTYAAPGPALGNPRSWILPCMPLIQNLKAINSHKIPPQVLDSTLIPVDINLSV